MTTIVVQNVHELEAVRGVLRANRAKRTPRRVLLRGGVYELPNTFRLGPQDSGHVTFETHPDDLANNNIARLSGGIRVPPSAFAPAKVPSGVAGVLVANLFALGLNASSLGGMAAPYPESKLELFYAGQPMTLARDPNVATDQLRTWQWVGYENATRVDDFTMDFADTPTGARWRKAMAIGDGAQGGGNSSELWLHAYTKYDWRDCYVRLAAVSLNTTSTRYTLRRDPQTSPQYPWVSGSRFYAVNNLALLDAPGEYYVSAGGLLYFKPPLSTSGVKGLIDDVYVSVLDEVVSSVGANHTSWANVVIEVARGNLVRLTGEHLSLRNVTARNAGAHCVSLSGSNNSVVASSVYGCGRAGVAINGGDLQTLARGNSSVVGNRIVNFSRIVRTYMPAVAFRGVGLLVANNTIEHGPHCAIQGGGNDNLFEHNSISHVTFECTDTGAFYVGRSWAERGNVARFNSFDTIRPTEKLAQQSCTQNAFYLDDQMSGWDFYGNTIRNASQGVFLGGGRHNRIHGNLFIDNDHDIGFDDRGLNWQNASCNINCTGSTTSCFRHTLDALHYTQPPYATRYPLLPTIYQDHPCVPVGNVIEDNRWCHRNSKGGGQFLNRDAATIAKWRSAASNNVEDCTVESRAAR